ncbi:bifunctional DNA primase/polymerase [Nonomuraea typhae]|uniref:Bifunctional DNA primase/polymerase n=1 Tax=Nonomuraea typhae TaxID=2603600 RepID=A0ABW7YKL3_9ACTN
MKTLLSAAVNLTARGWTIFPLALGDKVPLPGWRWKLPEFQTSDSEQARRKWLESSYNIGVACGASKLVVLDLDVPKPGAVRPPEWDRPGVNDGSDVLATLCEQEGQPLPLETFQVRSRRGGLHLYFAAPDGVPLGPSAGRVGWLIDVRAGDSYIVGPGSYVDQPDGTGVYQVLHDAPAAPLPDWLLARMRARPAPKPIPARASTPMASTSDRSRSYVMAALEGEVQRVLDAAKGTRNDALNEAAFALGQFVGGGVLPENTVVAALHAAASCVGLPGREAEATIRSGLSSGVKRPRGVR